MYIRRTTTYGNRKEIRKYHTFRFQGKGLKRAPREKETSEQAAQRNERQAIRKLKMLMINNFDLGDWHITLTYAKESRPDGEGARKILKRFFEKLRRVYRKKGKELKYIMVTEWESTNLHHHVAINDIAGIGKLFRELWMGGVFFSPLYENQNYDGLAEYFVKETKRAFRNPAAPFRQRYTCSRNLKKPEVEKKVIPASDWRETPKISPKDAALGYAIDWDSVVTGFDDAGFPYQEYTLIRYPGTGEGMYERGGM